MATDDQQVLVVGQAAAPTHTVIPGNGQIRPKCIYAHYDGTAAAGAFVPALKITSDGGEFVGWCPASTTVVAGASAEVTWFQGVGLTAASASALPIVETLFMDTRNAAGITSGTVFQSGASYLVSVQGTFSYVNHALDTGTPEPDAMFPTTGGVFRNSTQVGLDAETCFAFFNSGVHPSIGHITPFQIDLGSGFSHIEPFDGPHTTPTSDHFYTYQLGGQGSHVTFLFVDTPGQYDDNYGSLLITIYGIPGGGAPTGAAGGDLTGTYPNPTVANVSELTTKGDLLVGHGGNVSSRLAVGADTFVLTADAAQTNGIKWAAGGGGGVSSFAEQGQAALTGAVTISPGAGVTMSQVGQNVAISASTSGSGSNDGWLDDSAETWTYATGSGGGTATFTIGSDVHTKYTAGTRIKLTQTTVKFFVVAKDSTFGGGNTTVTITAGSDFTLANAAISANFHSYEMNPQGYPGWFNFAGAATGYASTTVTLYRFQVLGRQVTVDLYVSGTSNATTLNITLPITPGTAFADFDSFLRIANLGTFAGGLAVVFSGNITMQLFASAAGGGFNNTGTKAVTGFACYEI